MFQDQLVSLVRDTVSEVLRRPIPGDIRVLDGPGLTVEHNEKGTVITAESPTALARGFMRYAQEKEKGKTAFSVREEKHFASVGSFLDFSYNGVMTMDACKKYIAMSATLGMDTVVINIGDSFEVPEYPYMGYLRGRMTTQQLRAVDEYGASLGVEIIPCIQTLAHLGNFLQWRENQHMKDQPTILLIDDEDTYRFIDAEIRAVRAAVKGGRIHIGMDEAHNVGLGRYYQKHGPTDRFELLLRHLNKVVDICKKYDFHPIMWSDMFFRLGSRTDEYYDKDAVIPDSVVKKIPDVDLCYWDYYNTDPGMVEHMLSEHERLSNRTVYAGGVWNWSGFLPNVLWTRMTMELGLRKCMEHKTRTVLATTWGDDGNETDPFLVFNQMAIFSEYCFRGENCSHEDIAATGALVTHIPDEAYEAFGLLYPDETVGKKDLDVRWGKALIWCDPLYPLGPQKKDLPHILRQYPQAIAILEKYRELPECAYALKVFETALLKARLIGTLREKYISGDREAVRALAENEIPALLQSYAALRDAHKARWESIYKRNGWEIFALRYGSVMGRLEDARDALLRWCDRTLDTVSELDEEPLDPTRKYGMQFYQVYVSPVFSL